MHHINTIWGFAVLLYMHQINWYLELCQMLYQSPKQMRISGCCMILRVVSVFTQSGMKRLRWVFVCIRKGNSCGGWCVKCDMIFMAMQFKLCKVRSVQFGQKGIPYINTYDGRTICYPDPLIKANDTVKLDLETNKDNWIHKVWRWECCDGDGWKEQRACWSDQEQGEA